MFNLKNIFSENSENKNSKNTSSSFLGDGKAILDAVDDGVLAVDSKGNLGNQPSSRANYGLEWQ